MLFTRYRKPKRLEEPSVATTGKKSSLADALFRKLPIAFARRTRSKASLLSTTDDATLPPLPRHSTSLPNIVIEKETSTPLIKKDDNCRSYKRQRCATSTTYRPLQRHSLLFENIALEKRHSIEPAVYRLSKIINYDKTTDNKQRHSYTFGKQQTPKNLSLKDLILDPVHEKKLDSFLAQRQAQSPLATLNTNANTRSTASSTTATTTIDTGSATTTANDITSTSTVKQAIPAIVVPQRSASHQLLSPPKTPLLRAHSTSSSSIHQKEDTTQYEHSPLDPYTLVTLLQQHDNVMLIDVRHLVDYQKHRIRGSVNVNLPTLLIKRYQRGTVSNFHLENFITTAEGREQYLALRQSSTASNASSTSTLSSDLTAYSLSSSPSSVSSSSLMLTSSSSSSSSSASSLPATDASKPGEQDNQGKQNIVWVVYDDEMNEDYKVTQAWTLLNVLSKATSDTGDRVHYLLGGFTGFINSSNTHHWIEGVCDNMELEGDSDCDHSHSNKKRPVLSTSISSGTPTLQQKFRTKVSPRRSLSYTVGEGSKIQKQTSLFSLDTQAARQNNANALARRASRRSQQLQQLSVGSSVNSALNQHKYSTAAAALPTKVLNKQSNTDSVNQSSSITSTANNLHINNDITIQHQNIHSNNSNSSLLSIPYSLSTSTITTPSSVAPLVSSSTSLLASSSSTGSSASTSLAISSQSRLLSAMSINNATSSTLLARVMEEEGRDDNNNNSNEDEDEDEDEDILGQATADISPRTETDFDFTISEIIPGFLYVGPEIETADHADQLLARPIRRVLNMAEECHDRPLLQHHDDLQYRKIAARDTVEMRNIDHVMMEAVGFIEEAKRNHEPIYVHCKAGKSRSVTVILAYLVSCERWTLKQSYRHVIRARPNMSPNIGFIAELMKLENQVHGRVSSFLETDWQTASLPSPDFSKELKQLQLSWQQSPCSPAIPSTSSPASPVT